MLMKSSPTENASLAQGIWDHISVFFYFFLHISFTVLLLGASNIMQQYSGKWSIKEKGIFVQAITFVQMPQDRMYLHVCLFS